MHKLYYTVFSFLFLATTVLAGNTYELKLGREIRPADDYILSGYSTRIVRVQIREESGILTEVQHDTTTVRIKARCKVAGVTTDGQEAVKIVTIEQANVTRRGKLSELIPAGTSLKASFSDSGTVITKDGVRVDIDIISDLVAVIRSEGGKRTSEIMDAQKKVKVGQKWSMNVPAFKRSLDAGAQATVNHVKGQVHFIRVDTTASRPTALVELRASAKDALSEIQGTPTSSSAIAIHVALTVPLDPRYPYTRAATTTKMNATFGEGTGSAVVEMIVTDDLQFDR